MTAPLVSVLIPAFNAGRYLRPAVKSILEQSYTNLEIIVIDDGSTDGCINSILDFNDGRIRLLSQANAGKPAALNRALGTMSGEFYALQDADDLSHPNRIERQVRCLQQRSELAAVFTGWEIILNDRRLAPRFRAKSPDECRRDIERLRMPAHDPTGMYRLACVKDFRYEPSLSIGEGFDYILRVGEKFPMMVLGDCLYSYRVHFNSLMQKHQDSTQAIAQRILVRASQRRGIQLNAALLDGSASRRRWREHGTVTHFMESVLDLRRSGQPVRALVTAWECVRLRPADKLYYRPLLYAFAPQSLIEFYRSRKIRAR